MGEGWTTSWTARGLLPRGSPTARRPRSWAETECGSAQQVWKGSLLGKELECASIHDDQLAAFLRYQTLPPKGRNFRIEPLARTADERGELRLQEGQVDPYPIVPEGHAVILRQPEQLPGKSRPGGQVHVVFEEAEDRGETHRLPLKKRCVELGMRCNEDADFVPTDFSHTRHPVRSRFVRVGGVCRVQRQVPEPLSGPDHSQGKRLATCRFKREPDCAGQAHFPRLSRFARAKHCLAR